MLSIMSNLGFDFFLPKWVNCIRNYQYEFSSPASITLISSASEADVWSFSQHHYQFCEKFLCRSSSWIIWLIWMSNPSSSISQSYIDLIGNADSLHSMVSYSYLLIVSCANIVRVSSFLFVWFWLLIAVFLLYVCRIANQNWEYSQL